eukprot:CAMPEP_0119016516 /NCGR_PEP_ID=MMETSP1176-20130426/13358_1 /TAXON_ID=265551 /ORGANISM="Synedropsis recta cf, Strain CCMP1620" /LENGTH=142 /DNA_ID=CAMNT_0006969963 /DNA_START=121 /DNA_END=550 /DNA_ORIENTATION=+
MSLCPDQIEQCRRSSNGDRCNGINQLTARDPKAISTPDLKSMFGIKSSVDELLLALKSVDKNTPLKDCPNHLLGKFHLLDLANWCQMIKASETATRLLIQTVLVFPDSNEEKRAKVERMQKELELTPSSIPLARSKRSQSDS